MKANAAMSAFHLRPLRLRTGMFLLWILILLWAVLSGAPADSADGPKVRLDPDSVVIRVGEEFVVRVRIEDVQDLFGADVRLRFDANMLQVIDSSPDQAGVQVEAGVFPYPDFPAMNDVNNDTGEISYVVTQISPREPVNGSGTVFTIHFVGKNPGRSFLGIYYGILVRMEGVSFDAELEGGSVQVNDVSGATPYPVPPTLTPTYTASPTLRATNTPRPLGQPTATATAAATVAPTPAPTDADIATATSQAPSATEAVTPPQASEEPIVSSSATPVSSPGPTDSEAEHPAELTATPTREVVASPLDVTATPMVPTAVATRSSYKVWVPTPAPMVAEPMADTERSGLAPTVLRCLWLPLLLTIAGLVFYLRMKERFERKN